MNKFQELLTQCPQEIQNLVKEDSPFWDVYSRVVVEMKLDEQAQEKTHTEIMLVMVGVQKISDLHENLQNAGIPVEVTDVICDRIIKNIPENVFAILASFEKQIAEEESPEAIDENPAVQTLKTPDENAGVEYEKEEESENINDDQIKESKDDLISSIENPIPTRESPVKKIAPAEDFLSNKLSGTVTIPSTSSNTTPTQSSQKPEVKKYDKDPYREEIE
ncbi:MAG: hypothetical protein WC757_01625 [Candidatus Paceibacterota bacterium]|jgi:hypothetical protein